jgi:hypothetical protein
MTVLLMRGASESQPPRNPMEGSFALNWGTRVSDAQFQAPNLCKATVARQVTSVKTTILAHKPVQSQRFAGKERAPP